MCVYIYIERERYTHIMCMYVYMYSSFDCVVCCYCLFVCAAGLSDDGDALRPGLERGL